MLVLSKDSVKSQQSGKDINKAVDPAVYYKSHNVAGVKTK